MKLECTKKLLDYLGVKPEKTTSESAESDPLCAWTANLLTLNRRKAIVAVNPASRCMFVLYGITAKNIPKMPGLILEGIRQMLKSEYIRPEIIENYLDDCGRTVEFSPNSSRAVITVCNQACERVQRFQNIFEAGDLYQYPLLPWLNNDLHPKAGYRYTYEVLGELLQEKYGEKIRGCRAVELEVKLELPTPCTRTLIVPADMNFYQLHQILQGAFEWHDEHLHQFVLENKRDRPAVIVRPDKSEEDFMVPDGFENILPEFMRQKVLNSMNTRVGEVFTAYKKIVYEYDFGDGWTHIIKLKKFIEDCENPYPHCTKAVGEAPEEDCGGYWGFADKSEILKNPEHEEYEELCEWLGMKWWQPADAEKINRKISYQYRVCMPVWYE